MALYPHGVVQGKIFFGVKNRSVHKEKVLLVCEYSNDVQLLLVPLINHYQLCTPCAKLLYFDIGETFHNFQFSRQF